MEKSAKQSSSLPPLERMNIVQPSKIYSFLKHKNGHARKEKVEKANRKTMFSVQELVTIITRQKKSEEKLKLYHQIFASSNDAIAIVDTKGFYLEQNPSHRKLIEYSDEELASHTPSTHLGKESFREIIKELTKKGKYRGEVITTTKSGKRIDVDLSAFSVKNNKGDITHYIGIKRDITQRKRTEKERQFLAKASNILSSSLDYETTLHSVAKLTLSLFADYCVIDLINRKRITRIVTVHKNPAEQKIVNELRLHSPNPKSKHPLLTVLREGKPKLIPSVTAKDLQDATADPKHHEILTKLQPTSYMAVPLVARNKVIGALTFVATKQSYRYAKRDLVIAKQLANQAALAVDNARLFNEAKEEITERKKTESQLREYIQLLQTIYHVSELTNKAVLDDATYQEVLNAIMYAFRADRAAIVLVEDSGNLRFKAWKRLSRQYRKLIETDSPWKDRTKSLFVDDIRKEKSLTSFRKELTKENIQSLAYIPLIYQNKLVGKLLAYYNAPHAFTDDEKHLSLTIASHIAFAIERDKVQHELQKKEQHFRALIEKSSDAVTLVNRQGINIYASPSTSRILGYTAEEFLHFKPYELIHPTDRQSIKKLLQGLVEKQGKSIDGQYRMRHKNGRWLWIGFVATNLLHDPSVGAIVVNYRDITEQKNTEEMLRKSRDQLNIILQGVADGITVQDKAGNLIYVNSSAAIASGYASPDEMIQASRSRTLSQFELLDESGNPFSLERLPGRRALLGEIHPEEIICYRNRETNEQKWAFVKARPILDAKGTVQMSINIIQDITHLKESEQRKEEFLTIASHELKTPVTSIKAFAQLLKKRSEKEGNREFAMFLGKMDQQIDNLTELIADLLDVSRIQAGKITFKEQAFDLDNLILDIAEEMQRISQKHHIIVKGKTGKVIQADKYRVGQVLTNLISNAMKYSPKADKIIIHLTSDESSVTIAIEDFGIGIAKEDQKRVFERFFRITGPRGETFPGLGVGLYISSQIVKRHHGTMWVESQRGKGSTFYFTLPINTQFTYKETAQI